MPPSLDARAPARGPRPPRTGTSGTTPVCSQLAPVTASTTYARGRFARTCAPSTIGVTWSAAPGVRSPISGPQPLGLEVVGERLAGGVRPRADQRRGGRARRGSPPGSECQRCAPSLSIDVGDVHGLGPEQPAEHGHRGVEVAAAVGAQVEHDGGRAGAAPRAPRRGTARRARAGTGSETRSTPTSPIALGRDAARAARPPPPGPARASRATRCPARARPRAPTRRRGGG